MNLQHDFIIGAGIDIYKEMIVFGSGYYGKQIIFLLNLLGIKVVACFDNDKHVINTNLMDITKCIAPCYMKNIPIIISIRDTNIEEQVYQQCKKLGYNVIFTVDYKKLENYINNLPDKQFLEIQYAVKFGGTLIDWESPKTFNEKQQWMKLYDRNPKYTKLVDKLEVKKYVEEKIGSKFIIPTLKVWDSADDIDFDLLPKRFVLKCTHDSESYILCTSKELLDIDEVRKKINNALKTNYFFVHREWPYKNVKPRVLCEKFIGDEYGKVSYDYKVSCFGGEPKFYSVAVDRQTKLAFYYYDVNHKDITDIVVREKKEKKNIDLPHKEQLDEMLELARILSKGFPYVRVDFMISDRIYFSELTFFPDAGVGTDWNDNWLRKTGEMICLKEENER